MSDNLPPPNNLDAEAAVLSAVLIKPDLFALVEPIVRPSDFYSDSNRRIFEALTDLDAAGTDIDIATVAQQLKSRGRLEQVGGTPYLAQILDATPAVIHVEEHARIIAGLARVRQVQTLCTSVRAEGYAVREVDEWLRSVEGRVFDATATQRSVETISTLFESVNAEVAAAHERRAGSNVGGTSTGLPALDRIFGRLQDGCVYVLAARPGMGKTALALQLALSAARTDGAVYFGSLEMPREQLSQRALAQVSGVSTRAMQLGYVRDDEWPALADAASVLGALPVVIDDRAGQTVHGLRSSIRRGMIRLNEAHPDKPLRLIVIDYVQIMTPTSAPGSSRDRDVANMSMAICNMAKEFRCPVLLLSQLNREVEKRQNHRPQLSDLRDSGAIEQDAFGVMFLYREDQYRDRSDHDGTAEVIVAKHRQGATGTVKLRFQGEALRFFEVAEDVQDFDQYDNFADIGERM